MKRDDKGRPSCIGQGPTRRCGFIIHPGYSRCPSCDRPYTGEELQWCREQIAAQDAAIKAKQAAAKAGTPFSHMD